MKLSLPNQNIWNADMNQQFKASKQEKDKRVGDWIAIHLDKSPWEEIPKLNISFQLTSWWIPFWSKAFIN